MRCVTSSDIRERGPVREAQALTQSIRCSRVAAGGAGIFVNKLGHPTFLQDYWSLNVLSMRSQCTLFLKSTFQNRRNG